MSGIASSPARWWRRENDKVVCTLCPRECHIPAGQRGFCYVRANEGGELVLTTWGRSSGFCIDPIEKKPLNHFLPGTPVLSLGTAGCNLGCRFCQNWDISKSREMDTLADTGSPDAVVQAALDTGCRSIAFTYNDPTIWAEYAIDIAREARAAGLRTVAVTAGYISPEPRREFYQWIDAANVDLKAFTESFYRRLTQTHLQPVLDTIEYLRHETDVWFELTNLMIPGENDDPDETRAMCDWLAEHVGPDVPIHFTAFHPDFKMRDKPRTAHETLIGAREIALRAGLRYAYVGNVHDPARESTWCPGCGACVIERNWYELGKYELDGNRCRSCGETIPGVFDDGPDAPGTWGRKRQPVRLRQAPVQVTTSTSQGGSGMNPKRDADSPSEGQSDSSADAGGAAGGVAWDLPPVHRGALLAYAREAVRAVVTGDADAVLPPLDAELADRPAYGVFVTLERSGQLRGCRGRWGAAGGPASTEPPTVGLGELVASVARDTATRDGRFASISPDECDLLDLDVSILFDPQPVEAQGEARAAAIRPGVHGLMIVHPRGQGLLLPQVAGERGWDAATFLDQVCVKAGLPARTWRQPGDRGGRLTTFRAQVLTSSAEGRELQADELTDDTWRELADVFAARLAGADSASPAGAQADGAAEADASVARRRWPHELGVWARTDDGRSTFSAGAGQSLLDLVGRAADSMRELNERTGRSSAPLRRLVILSQPLLLKADDDPSRHAGLARSHAVLARGDADFGLELPGPQARDIATPALRQAGATVAQWRERSREGQARPRVTAFAVTGHDFDAAPSPAASPARVTTPRAGAIRKPAMAGRFYPDDARLMDQAVAAHLAAKPQADRDVDQASTGEAPPCRAIMLPHAGWVFCGDTIGLTLDRVRLPERVIVLSPKHTAAGPALSIASHDVWRFPGFDLPIDRDVVERLADQVEGLAVEPEAHRMEHGVEVLAPFLRACRPDVRLTPIVVGAQRFDVLRTLGQALADLLADLTGEPPLLVISSDMNHFASDAENRRLDRLALDAMRTGDPARLYETCQSHRISMCGLGPAVAVMTALNVRRPLSMSLVDYRTSGDASGDRSRVVGYAGATLT